MAHPPRPIQDLVAPVFREHRRQDHVTLAGLQKQWAALVGPGLAERTWPMRLQGGLLWIAAPDSSWAYQLQFLKEELLSSLRVGWDPCPVKELRFKVGKVPAADAVPAGGEGAVEDGGPGGSDGGAPASVAAAPELARAADAIIDPELRGAFLRALSKQARRHPQKR